MYEELLPYWKERCRRVLANERTLALEWVDYLKERNLTWKWINRHVCDSGLGFCRDCIVQDIMLFTWEAGLED